MAHQRPRDARVDELRGRDLAGVGAVGPVEDVLRGDLDGRVEVLAREQ